MNAGRVSPSVALAAYAEAWINGAKVVVFGDALSPLAERLLERGARHVQVYDVDAARAAEASAASTLKQIAYAPLDLAGSALRDGVFDVGIVEDLAVAQSDPKSLLSMLNRVLSRRGLALIGSRNPDVSERLIPCGTPSEQPLGYYDFYDAVSQHFEEVRMLGQTPFVGYAIADFSATDANDVRIDTALLPGGAEEPEWFLALASALPVSPDAFSVIQLPLADLELGASAEPALPDPAVSAQAERADARVRELEAALAALAADGAREAERYAAERARDAEKHASERARDAEKHASERARDVEKHATDRTREIEKVEKLVAERAREVEKLVAERARDAEKHAAERHRDAEKLAAERSRAGEKQTIERSREAEKRDLEKSFADKLQALQLELRKRDEWLEGLESRAATADERADEAQTEVEQRSLELRKAKDQLGRLEQQLDDERRAKQKFEQSARALEQGARAHEQTVRGHEQNARVHEQELDKVSRRADAEAQRAGELSAETKKLAARVAELMTALAESQKKAKSAAEEGAEEIRAELTQLEASLKERGAEVSRLTRALHETERFGRQLIGKVNELEAGQGPARPSPELGSLTRRNAELAANLEAARWTISSLEANVGLIPTESSSAAGSTHAGDAPSSSPAPEGLRRDEIPPTDPLPAPRAD